MIDTVPRAIKDLTPAPAPKSLETWRCRQCGRILAKMKLAPGSTVEIKCSSCNKYSEREVAASD